MTKAICSSHAVLEQLLHCIKRASAATMLIGSCQEAVPDPAAMCWLSASMLRSRWPSCQALYNQLSLHTLSSRVGALRDYTRDVLYTKCILNVRVPCPN
jgi:hypothetical protein